MKRPEQALQRAIFQHLRTRGAPGMFFWHTPNGGGRSKTEGAIFKGLGVVPGIPDIFAIHQGRIYGLEIKTYTGLASPAQIATLQAMQAAGATVAVAHGLDAALDKLTQWGLLRGATQ